MFSNRISSTRHPVLGVLAVTLCAAAGAAPANAQIQVYTDQTQWQSAAGLYNTDTLQSEGLGNHPTPYNTVGGWNINTLAGGITIQVFDNGSVDGSREFHFRDFGAQVRFTAPSGPYGSMGFNYRTSNEAWQLKLDGNIVATLPGNTNGFIGFTSNPPRQNFVLTSPSNVQGGISVDNISVGISNFGSLYSGAATYMRNHVPINPAQRLNRNQFEALVAAGQDYLISQGVDFLDASAMTTNALQMVQNAGYYYTAQGVTYYGSPVVTDQEISRLANMARTSGTVSTQLSDLAILLAGLIQNGSDDLSEARAYASSSILMAPLTGNDRLFADLVGNMCLSSFALYDGQTFVDWPFVVGRGVAAAVAGALIPAAGPLPPISPYILQGAATMLAAANSLAAAQGTAVSPNAALPGWHDYELFALGVAIVDVSQNNPCAAAGCCLGGTGNDGVRIAAPALGDHSLGAIWRPMPPNVISPNAALHVRNEVVTNSGTVLVGFDAVLAAANDWRTSPVNLTSTTFRVEVRNGNVLVGSFAARSGVASDTDQPPLGISPYHIGGTGQDGIRVAYPGGTHITVANQTFVGTEVCMIPEGVSPVGTSISGMRITSSGIAEINFVSITGTHIGCPGDFNYDGIVSSQDFFDFISAFFSGSLAADFNDDGVLSSQDFFDFIVAFFQGC